MKKVIVALALVISLAVGSMSYGFADSWTAAEVISEQDPRTADNTYVVERGTDEWINVPAVYGASCLYNNMVDGLEAKVYLRSDPSASTNQVRISTDSTTPLGIYPAIGFSHKEVDGALTIYALVVDKSKVFLNTKGRTVHMVGYSGDFFQIQTKTTKGKWKTIRKCSAKKSYKVPKSVAKVRVRRVIKDEFLGNIYGKWNTIKL